MQECQRVLGASRGAAVCEMIEASIEGPCPCKIGKPCPLLSGQLSALDLDPIQVVLSAVP